MVDIGWRGLMAALVFLVDLVVFIDLARDELSDVRARRARRRASAAHALRGDQGHALAGRAR